MEKLDHSHNVGVSDVKCKTVKFLEDSVTENLDNLGYSDAFLDKTPKTACRRISSFLEDLNFLEQFKVHNKIMKKVQRFPYALPPHMPSFYHYQHPPPEWDLCYN